MHICLSIYLYGRCACPYCISFYVYACLYTAYSLGRASHKSSKPTANHPATHTHKHANMLIYTHT